jgi:protein associated with RNAse G/E
VSRPQHEAAGLREITVSASNYDGTPHWVHAAWLVRVEDGFVQTATPPNTPVRNEGDGYVSPYDTRGHYWTDRWFNVIRLETPGEGLFGYYCNIATPLEFDGATVRYVDLQIDVRVYAQPDGGLTYAVVDEDEFAAARERYGYAEELVSRCYAAVDELVAMVEAREFPFDG